ncbi:MAG: AAA family ATPase [Simkania sp.]|nr:AAA family ATPase [Simkania sp.]
MMLEKNHLHSTLLFHGPKGVGKARCAEIVAHYLLEAQPQGHPDLHHLIPEGKNEAHTMGSMRELIREVGLPPFQAKVKVFIIHQAERLTENCMNALLKTLEEPPLDTHFILLCEEIGMLLPTILSRCCSLRFAPLSKAIIAQYLVQTHSTDVEEAQRIASFSHGSLGKALELFHKKETKQVKLIRQLLKERLLFGLPAWHDILLQIDADEEEKQADLVFEEILFWFRDLHCIKEGYEESLYHRDSAEILKEQAKILLLPPMMKIYNIVTKAQLSLQVYVRSRYALESALLQLTL